MVPQRAGRHRLGGPRAQDPRGGPAHRHPGTPAAIGEEPSASRTLHRRGKQTSVTPPGNAPTVTQEQRAAHSTHFCHAARGRRSEARGLPPPSGSSRRRSAQRRGRSVTRGEPDTVLLGPADVAGLAIREGGANTSPK